MMERNDTSRGRKRAHAESSTSSNNNEGEPIYIRFPASLLRNSGTAEIGSSEQGDSTTNPVQRNQQTRLRLRINANESNNEERERMSNRRRQARYRSNHREEVRAYQETYRSEHTEQAREYRASHAEQSRRYRAEHAGDAREYRAERTEEARQYRAEHAEQARRYRAEHTEEYRQYQSEYRRNHRRSEPSNRTSDEPPSSASNEQASDAPNVNDSWTATINSYEAEIRNGPTVICFCCANLYFQKNTRLTTKEQVCEWGCESDVVEQAFWAINNNILNEVLSVNQADANEATEYRICLTCRDTMKKSQRLPTIALYNGLHFPKKVNCVDTLTRLEERLVSPRHIFQTLWTHKGIHGQYRSKGAVINVPVTVDTTVSSFPRNFDDTSTVHVHLARKMTYTKNYMQGVVKPAKIWEAARYLQHTPLYIAHDVQLTDQGEWERTNLNNNGPVPDPEGVTDDQTSGDLGQETDDDYFGDDFNDIDLEELFNEAAENETSDSNVNETTEEEVQANPGVRETVVIDENQILRMAPAEGNTPLSILMDDECMFLAFVKVFYGHKLETTVSKHAMYKSLIRSFDRRAATRPDLLLFMNSSILLNKMKSNINIILRKKTKNTNDGSVPLTAASFSDNDAIDTMLNSDQAYKVFSGIRSSSAYWKGQKQNVMAMIAQFGIPTLFVTLSAAESYWPELLCILKKVVDNDTISETEAEQLTFAEKSRLIQSDPVTCARYFDHRFRELKKTWMQSNEDGPFANYKIREYYFRVEFQHRGSPHIHMLIWLKDAPLFENKICSSRSEAAMIHDAICDFVDKIITCRKTWDGSAHHRDASLCTEESWNELIRTRQTHKHTGTCKRKRRNVEICRFNIPFPPMKETKILSPLSENEVDDERRKKYSEIYRKIDSYLKENFEDLAISDTSFEDFLIAAGVPSYEDYIFALRSSLKLNKIYLKRAVNEITINNYNTKIISMMRSNMDIQFVLDPYACCSYIVDYINKADKGMSKALEEIYEKHRNDPASKGKDLLRDLTNTYYNTSEVSAQEACYNILGFSFYNTNYFAT